MKFKVFWQQLIVILTAMLSLVMELMTILSEPAWAGTVASMATNSAETPA